MSLSIPKYRIIDFEKDYFCEQIRSITIPLFDSSANTYFCTCCNPSIPCIPVSNRYMCDICKEMYEDIADSNPDKNIRLIKIVGGGEICSLCFEKNKTIQKSGNSETNKMIIEETNDSDLETRYDTIHYDIDKELIVDSNTGLYVIHEYDNVAHSQYNNYILLCIENCKVILNYILDSYNPYFGIEVIEMSMNLEKTEACLQKQTNLPREVFIKYYEKHKICEVKLKLDRDGGKQDYMIDGILCKKPIGQVIEFIVGGKKSKNLRYFDY